MISGGREVAEYIPGKGENLLWDESAAELKSPYDFKYFVLDITRNAYPLQKELIRMQCLSQIKTQKLWLSKASLSWFLENVWSYIDADELSVVERAFVGGTALNVFFYTYQYDEAEKIASIVGGQGNIAEETYKIEPKAFAVHGISMEKAKADLKLLEINNK